MSINFKLIASWCVFSTIVACWAAPASAQNLVLNPGFEDGTGAGFPVADKWGVFAGGAQGGELDTVFPRSGTTALKLCCGTVNPSGGDFVVAVQRVLNIIPGTKYTFDLWARSETNSYMTDGPDGNGREDVGVKFEWHSSTDGSTTGSALDIVEFGFLEGDTGIGILSNPVLNDTYQQYTFEATAPAGSGHFRPVFAARNITDAVYFDDISLTQLLPPDTPNFTINIDRGTGNISLDNNGTAAGDIKEIKITSASGALDPISWTSVAGNYDLAGDDSVDADDNWTRQTQTSFELRETGNDASDGGTVGNGVGDEVDLGNNAWIKSLTEDLVAEVIYADNSAFTPGVTANVAVTFSGGPNGGNSFDRSDLNFDGTIDASDWPLLRDNLFASISTTSKALAYQSGDLNGDFKADFGDLNIFKADFNAALGAGAFAALVSNVPEPSSFLLLAFGAMGISLLRKRRTNGLGKAACLLAVAITTGVVAPSATFAADVDFTTFTVDDYPLIDGDRFNHATYTTATNSAVLGVPPNTDPNVFYSSNPHVFYGTQSILNKRITGTINPGSDDDFVGLALGYTAGFASTLDPDTNPTGADFLLLDWKNSDSDQELADDFVDHSFFFHDLTLKQLAKEGVALSRVTGSPTGDELWGHIDTTPANSGFDNNPHGGVTELQRGAASGSTGYVKNQDFVFDIAYTPSNVTVKINGTEEINVSGSFPDGVFGLYSLDQNPLNGAPTYSNFKISDFDEGLLTATINTLSGSVTLSNETADPITLDGYVLESASGSLDSSSWSSLQDQNLAGFAAGNGTGNGWEEAASSSDSVLVEANQAVFSTLGAGASVTIGSAFANGGSQDLIFTYSEGNGLVSSGLVSYVSTVLAGDYNGNGTVDAADYSAWLDNLGAAAGTLPNDTDGGAIGQAQYNTWKANFGATSATGTGGGSVPEPGTALMLILATCSLLFCRSRR